MFYEHVILPFGPLGAIVGITSSETVFIADIVLLLIVGRGLGEVMQRFGQPAVMGQLIGGILLGPSLFGWVWPDARHIVFPSDPEHQHMLNALSQLGILMLLLLTGMETDLRLVRRVGKACISISTVGVAVPLICGFLLAEVLPESLLPDPSKRIVSGLFLGTALAISSVKIVAMVVREMNFMRRNLGQVIVSSAIIEDTIGWIIIAIIFGIAGNGKLEPRPLLITVAEVAAFMVFSFIVGRRIVFAFIRWTNDFFHSEFAVVTTVFIIMGLMALVTNAIGVHSILGAFVAGILVGESPLLSTHIQSQLRGIITAFFMPIFFGMAGLSADLTVLRDPQLALLTAALVAVASFGKFAGAFIGGRLGRMNWNESMAIGCAMNARGSTEVIIATIGLSTGLITESLFTMIVTMAMITTLAMPPMLRSALRRLPIGPEEKRRLEREQMDQRGFVPNLERLLILVDDSAMGKFTSYLAGLVGGGRGMPSTVLHLDADGTNDPAEPSNEHIQHIERAAKISATSVEEHEDMPVDRMILTARKTDGMTGNIVAEESRKGYSLLLLGMNKPLTPKGSFTRRFSEVVESFDGPVCLVLQAMAKGGMPELDEGATILVPVNGTDEARHAAEVALAVARPHRAKVRALYVSRQEMKNGRSLSHRREEAVLKDIVRLAERYGVSVETMIQPRGATERAILKEAGKDISLVAMGVHQRPGKELFFGDTARAVILGCPCPVVLIATTRVSPDNTGQEARRASSLQTAVVSDEGGN